MDNGPSLHFHCLVQENCGEGDGIDGCPKGKDINIRILVGQVRNEEADKALVECIHYGNPESHRVVALRVLATLVQLGQRQECLCRDVFIEDPEDQRRQGCEEEVEEYHLPVIDHGGAGETAEKLVPEEQVDVALQAESVAL